MIGRSCFFVAVFFLSVRGTCQKHGSLSAHDSKGEFEAFRREKSFWPTVIFRRNSDRFADNLFTSQVFGEYLVQDLRGMESRKGQQRRTKQDTPAELKATEDNNLIMCFL